VESSGGRGPYRSIAQDRGGSVTLPDENVAVSLPHPSKLVLGLVKVGEGGFGLSRVGGVYGLYLCEVVRPLYDRRVVELSDAEIDMIERDEGDGGAGDAL